MVGFGEIGRAVDDVSVASMMAVGFKVWLTARCHVKHCDVLHDGQSV